MAMTEPEQVTVEEEIQLPEGADRLAAFVGYPNLMDFLDEEEIADIGRKALDGLEEDEESEAEWVAEVEEAREIVSQAQEEKTYPFVGAASIKYPLILTAVMQFNARATPVILNDGQVALGKVIGSDKGILKEGPQGPLLDPNGEPVFEVPPGAKRARADRVSAHMSYQLMEEMEHWSDDMDRLTLAIAVDGSAFKKIYFSEEEGRNESEFVSATDLIVNDCTKDLKSCPRVSHVIPLYPHEIKEKIQMGVYEDPDIGLFDDDENVDPIDVVEQHTLIDLDEDDYPEPYIVTFHRETGKVFRIVANYGLDDIVLNPQNEVMRVKKREYFVHYYCFPDPKGGFKGKGFGQLLLHLNLSVNSLVNLLIDAGHLSNTGGGFLGQGFRTQSGSFRFQPGEWKKVDVSGMSLRDAILPLPVRDPSPVLFNLLGFLVEAAKEVSSVQDVMTGGGAPNAAVGTTLAQIEQGMKVYTSIVSRIYRSLKKELKLLYRLNAEYLQDQAYFQVMDDEHAIARQDYALEGTDIAPAADPNMATDVQRAYKTQTLTKYFGTPFANSAEIMVEDLKFSGVESPERFLAPPPPPGPSPEELKELAELNIKNKEADASILQKIADSVAKISKSDLDGGDAVVNAKEIAFIRQMLEQQGVVVDDESNPGAVPGMEGMPMVPGLSGQGNGNG